MTDLPVNAPKVIWLNGRFLPPEKAGISPFDRGFQYGDGVFETIRSQRGTILYLAEHLQRLRQSLAFLKITSDWNLQWEEVLQELLERNDLSDKIASIKIIATRGIIPGPGLPDSAHPTLCVIAQRYDPPEESAYEHGWRLELFATGFSPPLARFKTLNYLYFLTARQDAFEKGANDAVILDPEGRIAETSIGTLLARTQGKWWRPLNSFQLPGITIRAVTKLLEEKGQTVEKRPSFPKDLEAAETVWILNSLIGIMPIRRIGQHSVPEPAAKEAKRLRQKLFAERA